MNAKNCKSFLSYTKPPFCRNVIELVYKVPIKVGFLYNLVTICLMAITMQYLIGQVHKRRRQVESPVRNGSLLPDSSRLSRDELSGFKNISMWSLGFYWSKTDWLWSWLIGILKRILSELPCVPKAWNYSIANKFSCLCQLLVFTLS